MIKKLDRKPVLGNFVLAFIFGGTLLAFTLFVFAGHPQLWMFASFSMLGMIVVFTAGTAHDRDQRRQHRSQRERYPRRRAPRKRRQRQLEYAPYEI